eukprot:jgi/Mesen1/917/ME000117S00075
MVEGMTGTETPKSSKRKRKRDEDEGNADDIIGRGALGGCSTRVIVSSAKVYQIGGERLEPLAIAKLVNSPAGPLEKKLEAALQLAKWHAQQCAMGYGVAQQDPLRGVLSALRIVADWAQSSLLKSSASSQAAAASAQTVNGATRAHLDARYWAVLSWTASSVGSESLVPLSPTLLQPITAALVHHSHKHDTCQTPNSSQREDNGTAGKEAGGERSVAIALGPAVVIVMRLVTRGGQQQQQQQQQRKRAGLEHWVAFVHAALVSPYARTFKGGGGDDVAWNVLVLLALEGFADVIAGHPNQKKVFAAVAARLLVPLLRVVHCVSAAAAAEQHRWHARMLAAGQRIMAVGLFHPTHLPGFAAAQGEGVALMSYHKVLFEHVGAALRAGDGGAAADVAPSLGCLLTALSRQLQQQQQQQQQAVAMDEERRAAVLGLFGELLQLLLDAHAHALVLLQGAQGLLAGVQEARAHVAAEHHNSAHAKGRHMPMLTRLCAAALDGARVTLLLRKEGEGEGEGQAVARSAVGVVRQLVGMEHRAVAPHMDALCPWLLLLLSSSSSAPLADECVALACQLVDVHADLRQLDRWVPLLLQAVRQHAAAAGGGGGAWASAARLVTAPAFTAALARALHSMPHGQVAPLVRSLAFDMEESASVVEGAGGTAAAAGAALVLARVYGTIVDSLPVLPATAAPLAAALLHLLTHAVAPFLAPHLDRWERAGARLQRTCTPGKKHEGEGGGVGGVMVLAVYLAAAAALAHCSMLAPLQLAAEESSSSRGRGLFVRVGRGRARLSDIVAGGAAAATSRVAGSGGAAAAAAEELHYRLQCAAVHGLTLMAAADGDHDDAPALAGKLLTLARPPQAAGGGGHGGGGDRSWELLCATCHIWAPWAAPAHTLAFVRTLLRSAVASSSSSSSIRGETSAPACWPALLQDAHLYEQQEVRALLGDALLSELRSALPPAFAAAPSEQEQEQEQEQHDVTTGMGAVHGLLRLLLWLPQGYLSAAHAQRCTLTLSLLEKYLVELLEVKRRNEAAAAAVISTLGAARAALAWLAPACRPPARSLPLIAQGASSSSAAVVAGALEWLLHSSLQAAARRAALLCGEDVALLPLTLMGDTRSLLWSCCHAYHMRSATRLLLQPQQQVAPPNSEEEEEEEATVWAMVADASTRMAAVVGAAAVDAPGSRVIAARAGAVPFVPRTAKEAKWDAVLPEAWRRHLEQLAPQVVATLSSMLLLSVPPPPGPGPHVTNNNNNKAAMATAAAAAALATCAAPHKDGKDTDDFLPTTELGGSVEPQEGGGEGQGVSASWGDPGAGVEQHLLEAGLEGRLGRAAIGHLLAGMAAVTTIASVRASSPSASPRLPFLLAPSGAFVALLGSLLAAVHRLLLLLLRGGRKGAAEAAAAPPLLEPALELQFYLGQLEFVQATASCLGGMRAPPPVYRRMLSLHLTLLAAFGSTSRGEDVLRGAVCGGVRALARGASKEGLACLLADLLHSCASPSSSSSMRGAAVVALELVYNAVSGAEKLRVVAGHTPAVLAALARFLLPSSSFAAKEVELGVEMGVGVGLMGLIAARAAIFPMHAPHVALALHLPALLLLKDGEGGGVAEACCKLLCASMRHRPREARRCGALIGDSLRALLRRLVLWHLPPLLREGEYASSLKALTHSASCLSRVYEEVAEHKTTLGKYCVYYLSDYVSALAASGGPGPCLHKVAEVALRKGAHAMLDACSPFDLQHLHAALGGGLRRGALAQLKQNYERHYKYSGKI